MGSLLAYIVSPDFVYMWIRVATPILFASLGAVICERSGVVNLGLEGIMLISALFGVIGSYLFHGLIPGMLTGILASIIASSIFAYFHLIMRADNVLCGTAINTLASGLTVFVLQMLTNEKGTSASIKSFVFPTISIPFIRDIPVLGKIISGHNILTYFAILSVFLVAFFIYKTPVGIRLRAVGENPNAATSVGISVIKMRFLAIILCGVLASFGGMYLSMGYLNMFTREMTAGRGFISLAACAMGQATPFGSFFSAMIFALFDGLSNILQILRMPAEFVQMLPYVATIIGLTVFSIRKKMVEKSVQLHKTKG